jgi:Family of unknown function (DUF6152)
MKNKLSDVALVFFALLVLAIPVFAHHSFQAEFDGSKVIYVTGTLAKFDWENPHMYFYLDVKDTRGKVTPWVIEGASPNVVKRTGTSRQDFIDNIGKTVTARACPAKNGTPRAAAETIKVSDGRELVVGGKRYSGEDSGKSEY